MARKDWVDAISEPLSPLPGDPRAKPDSSLWGFAANPQQASEDIQFAWDNPIHESLLAQQQRLMDQTEMVSGMTGGLAGHLSPLAKGIPTFADLYNAVGYNMQGFFGRQTPKIMESAAQMFDALPAVVRRTISKIAPAEMDGIKLGQYSAVDHPHIQSGEVQLDPARLYTYQNDLRLKHPDYLGRQMGFDNAGVTMAHEAAGHGVDRALYQLFERDMPGSMEKARQAGFGDASGGSEWFASPLTSPIFGGDQFGGMRGGGMIRPYGAEPIENFADALSLFFQSPNHPLLRPGHKEAVEWALNQLEMRAQKHPEGLP